ncbi:peptidase, M16 family [Fructobacillus pseudoficulneus]|uniref:Peptidase, M16 family n=1 Tax=Fructobacillus pseudoficulneus TaxID=220714 RepID=A0A3F3H829_9LACO|nr:pitrilysin family protein [Fructobacillus pseudoficulneus]GAP02809.1 peptidase, M16 family [Fructobacillus pseudoficulneus]SEH40091.1 Predicted Zn-dependent peptidase [Fructobacillus pseudoficulneus]
MAVVKSKQQEVQKFQTIDGLHVTLIKKPGYHQLLGALSTKFGSLITAFRDGQNEEVVIPAGTAHFLEHKLFDKEAGDALLRFTELGADANAFTGPNQTTYYFTATNQLAENLTWLLTFVQKPYFTEAKVSRERGIIEEEIKLYQDDPAWQLYQGILGLLYPKSPLSLDIAGTAESLQAISADLLYQIHAVFYQPENLELTVVGDFDFEQVHQLVDQVQTEVALPKSAISLPNVTLLEQSNFDRKLPVKVSVPKAAYGLRLPTRPSTLTATDRVSETLLGELTLDLIFGDQTTWFQEKYQEGIFGDDFDYEYTNLPDYHYLTFFVDGQHQAEAQKAIIDRLAEAQNVLKVAEAEFVRLKKAMAGQMLASQNSPERLGLDEDLILYGLSLFDKISLTTRFNLEDVLASGKRLFEGGRLSRLILEK